MNDWEMSKRLVADSAERFARETAGHTMTILHDNGLYRHLKFADPGRGLHYFDLITWPHGLLVRGDGPNFAFSAYPTTDLFDLFKGSASEGINPGYWQEKVVAGQVKSWSEEQFRAWLTTKATEAEVRFPGLTEAVDEQILNSDEHSIEYEATARWALAEFTHGDYCLRFPVEWEQSFDDFSWEYLWGCHAIVEGIRQYDAAKAEAAVDVPALLAEVQQLRANQARAIEAIESSPEAFLVPASQNMTAALALLRTGGAL